MLEPPELVVDEEVDEDELDPESDDPDEPDEVEVEVEAAGEVAVVLERLSVL